MKVLPFDQYIVKTRDLGRLAKRNRKFIRAYSPAPGKEQVRYDSAWGARGHWNRSADSSDNQGNVLTVAGTEAQGTTRSYPDSSPGEGDLGMDQIGIRQGRVEMDPQRSTHTDGSNTPGYKNHIP